MEVNQSPFVVFQQWTSKDMRAEGKAIVNLVTFKFCIQPVGKDSISFGASSTLKFTEGEHTYGCTTLTQQIFHFLAQALIRKNQFDFRAHIWVGLP